MIAAIYFCRRAFVVCLPSLLGVNTEPTIALIFFSLILVPPVAYHTSTSLEVSG